MQVPPFTLSKQLAKLGPELDQAVSKVLLSGQYIGGEVNHTFEKNFADSVGVPYAVGCNSGTDALVLALRGLSIGLGDEVITTSFSFFATAESISAVGATPVFVDVDPKTYLLDLHQIEKAITPATKAILPVHLFGCPIDMTDLMDIANKYGLRVIEDCAQASGAFWNGCSVGSWGDVGCFSFFPTKNLGAAGDGGAVTTKDADLAKKMRQLSVHGMPRRYFHTELGYNSRLDALQAAVLNVKLPHLSSWVLQRQSIAKKYRENLQDLPGLDLPIEPIQDNAGHAWNQFVVRVTSFPNEEETFSDKLEQVSLGANYGLPDARFRDQLKEKLLDNGINTIIYYPIPIHLQPAYKSLGYTSGSLPVTEKLCSQVLSLPIFPELSTSQVEFVIKVVVDLMTVKN